MVSVTKYKRSLIKKYFTDEDYLRLYEITLTHGVDNNTKYLMMQDYLNERNIPFTNLATGTNRCGILIDGYVVKIALDHDGINN